MPAVQDAELDTLLRATSTNVLAWFETRNLLPSEDEATRFLDRQSWMSAVRLVGATDPLIHVCVNVVRDLIPSEADALGELLHVQLARVCASGWVGSRATHEEDVAVGLTAELRAWLLERKRGGQLSPDVVIRPLEPGPTSSLIHLQTDAISYIVMAGVDRHLTETRAQTYLLKLNRIRSTLGITAAELARLLRVSREAIRKWEHGDPIAPDRWPDIDRLLEAAQTLLGYFKPEYVPSVIRRPVPDLNNDTPLDYLASRRFDELAAYFDEKFHFGTTA
jgi:transcriptional regulator with XRE-family HTH domain